MWLTLVAPILFLLDSTRFEGGYRDGDKKTYKEFL